MRLWYHYHWLEPKHTHRGIPSLIWENLVFVFVSQCEEKNPETIEDTKYVYLS